VTSMQCDNTPLMPPRQGLIARKGLLQEGTDAVDGKEVSARVAANAAANQHNHTGAAAMDVDGPGVTSSTAPPAGHNHAMDAAPFANPVHARANSAMAQGNPAAVVSNAAMRCIPVAGTGPMA